MADSAVAITAGSGTNIDTRTESTNGNHRQVVVVGDPADNSGIAPVDGTAGLKVNLGADNDVTVTGTVTVTGSTTVIGTVSVTGSTSVINTVNVTGSTTVINTVNVTGSTTIIGTVAVTGSTTVVGTVSVTGSTTVVNTVAVTGSTSLVAIKFPSSGSLSYNLTGATTNLIVVPSHATLSIYITDLIVSSLAAGNIKFAQTNASTEGNIKIHPLYFAANGGMVAPLRNPIKLSATTNFVATCVSNTSLTIVATYYLDA